MNLKKGLPQPGTWPGYLADTRQNGQKLKWPSAMAALADSVKVGGLHGKQQARQLHSICVGGSLWAILGVNAEALTMLRGPIRRRPYNRGEIVAKNAMEMGVFYDFY
ncbi:MULTISPECIES: hypothetical protein [Pseudomonas]|uniref:Uncharacterized protein n=1 Tax=Pseudomonas lurida TaxID=244566 RepID=A0ABY9FXI5_9PSED|nr:MULTISPECIES: hypothetical protein [Pseudomonas]AOE77749.1 hypothetical protein A7318_03900 [Pseudomonas lurida]AVJ36642.1 hypothetical protein CLM75_04600 [Pseudomonas lurida]MBC3233065.1 hypothetical protein [Pseudomonas lurida]MBC3239107.1 hypothetical protein [Pseudomonas lurida]MBC3243842.1 hypothetical protein [Pseudomonas lurida]